MTYRVTSVWAGRVAALGYTTMNDIQSFRETVECLSQEDFLACVDAQNVTGWAEIRDIVFSVYLSPLANETLDVENQIYTRTVDWPTKQSYEEWSFIKNNLLSSDPADYNGVMLGNPYVYKIQEVAEEI